MNFIFKHIKFIFFTGIFSCLLILNNSCQTFDELQSDYLLQRDTIETLTNRVNTLTQELIEQNTITSSLIEDVSQLNEEVSVNAESSSENSELLQGAINEVNGITGAVEDIEDNLENISYYIGDLIEESGDLSGDLNNLLSQVTRIDLITTDLYSTINNLDIDLHDHEDLDDLADLMQELVAAQREILQIRRDLATVQAQLSSPEGSGGSASEPTEAIIGEWVLSSASDPSASKNNCPITKIIFSNDENEALTFVLYSTAEDPIYGSFSVSFDSTPFEIKNGTISLLVSETLKGEITDIIVNDSDTIISAKFDLDGELCDGQRSITYTSDVDLENNTNTPDEDTENNSGGTPVEDTEDNTDTPVEDIEVIEDNTEIIICSDCPQKISGYDIFIAGTSETEGAVYWVNGQKNALNVNSFASDITVDNGKVFVSGYAYGSGAQYWEINGQNIIQNDLPGFEGEGQSILVKDNSVYVGGYYSHADGMSGAYGCYWKDGVKYKNSGGGDHGATGIAVKSNGDVLTAGYFLNGHHYVIPASWKNNVKSNLSTPGQSDGEAVTVKLKSNGTAVYGGIISAPHNFLGSITKPVYWAGTQRKTCEIGSVNNGGWQNSGVHGLALDGNKVYQAGWTMNMEGQYPTYWKNQTKHLLPGATVNGTRYDQGKATDIAIIDGKVVVVGMLTGAPILDSYGVQIDYGYGDGPEVNNDTGYACIWIDGTIHILDTQGDFEVGGFFIQ
ncbi:hypothetical protein N9392_00835 [Flavobacteriaceae bacterium]|nr:hypothetical protein [Flavobacteriaceae bacterium]